MQASQNTVTYNVLVAFEKYSGKCMPSPFSHCSCPAGTHCCSHFLAALLVIKHIQLFQLKIEQLEIDPECKWRNDITDFTNATITKCTPQGSSQKQPAQPLFRPRINRAQAMLRKRTLIKQTDTKTKINFVGLLLKSLKYSTVKFCMNVFHNRYIF